MPIELHVADVGLPFEVSVLGDDGVTPLDLSHAVLLELRFQRPDGSMLVCDGVSTVVDGSPVVRYYFADGDLDVDGTWRFQLRVDSGGGEVFWSPIVKFKVKPNLPIGA